MIVVRAVSTLNEKTGSSLYVPPCEVPRGGLRWWVNFTTPSSCTRLPCKQCRACGMVTHFAAISTTTGTIAAVAFGLPVGVFFFSYTAEWSHSSSRDHHLSTPDNPCVRTPTRGSSAAATTAPTAAGGPRTFRTQRRYPAAVSSGGWSEVEPLPQGRLLNVFPALHQQQSSLLFA